MRNACAAELTEIATANPELVLLSGDIGNQLFDKYKKVASERFFNCGVAEQNMISMAAGLALSGFRPVAYTIAPFITYRCFEQIRVDLCYHHAPVVVIGVGAGLSYASLGATHVSCEDIAIMRSLPNMQVICPGDALEVRAAIRAAVQSPHPSYIRLGKKGEPAIHKAAPEFSIGKGIVITPGEEVTIFATGTILPLAIEIADALKERNLKCEVISLHTIKPLDKELIERVFLQRKLVVTIEEHGLIGGLGAALAEWKADFAYNTSKLLRFGAGDFFVHEAGEQEYARERHGLDVKHITGKVLANIS